MRKFSAYKIFWIYSMLFVPSTLGDKQSLFGIGCKGRSTCLFMLFLPSFKTLQFFFVILAKNRCSPEPAHGCLFSIDDGQLAMLRSTGYPHVHPAGHVNHQASIGMLHAQLCPPPHLSIECGSSCTDPHMVRNSRQSKMHRLQPVAQQKVDWWS